MPNVISDVTFPDII